MDTQNLRRFGQRVQEERATTDRAALASAFTPKSAAAKAAEALAWSTVLNKGGSEESVTEKRTTDSAEHASSVLGPSEHTEFLDEAVEASVHDRIRMPAPRVATAAEATRFGVVVKEPVTKVTGLRRRTRKGTLERVLLLGKDEIVINPLDWAGVLAVMSGKTGKVVVNGCYSFGRANSTDIIRIRALHKDVVAGEISITALNKLI